MPGAAIATLSKAQLFVHLAEGLAGGVTVLTPNQRLAQALAAHGVRDEMYLTGIIGHLSPESQSVPPTVYCR